MNLILIIRGTNKLALLSTICLSAMLLLASCATSSSQARLSVTVYPASSDVNIGDTLTFDVLIDTEVLSRGAQCTLTFNPDVITCTGITEGNFYKDWAVANGCTTVLVPEPVIDNENGRISDIGIAILGTTEGGVKGKGVLFTYHFSAIAKGVAAPGLSDIIISDELGNTLQVQ